MTDAPSRNPEKYPLGYPESLERASEYLRRTLVTLAQQRLAPNPLNFSLIYAYETACDPQLRKALDQLHESGRPLTPELARALFLRHLSGCEENLLQQCQEELLRILNEAREMMNDFTNEASQASLNFEAYAQSLKQSRNLKESLRTVFEVITDTRHLAQRSQFLEQQLAANMKEMEQLRRELRHAREEAETDALTGLLNRRAFDRIFEQRLKKAAHGVPMVCLIMLDIDHFKKVNDTYGHPVGDQLLKALAELLVKTVKGRDRIARVGGEEFAILLTETLIIGARSVAEDIRMRVESTHYRRTRGGNERLNVTVSLGVAAYHHGESCADFYDRCDRALYHAKQSGRNRVFQAD